MYPAAKVFADDVSLYTRGGPGLVYKSFRVSAETGPANGKLDRDETADITLVLRNAGTASPAVNAQLTSLDPRLTVLDGQGSFGPAGEADTTVSVADWFRVSASADAPIEVPLYCRLTLSGSGYDDTLRIPIIVGDSMNLPAGPDQHGYRIYDYTDSCYARRPDYDWLELRGVGTRLVLGGDDTRTIGLPAGFGAWQYYGTEYDSISVCSNGWVAAGPTDRVDFVNVQLPYGNSPGNIVAVCWDDLDPTDFGSIWYLWDSAGHRFVVEYDSVPYFGHPQHWEKVQVQVHDRTVSTPTGDNSITIHFRTANDYTQATVGMQNADGTDGLTHCWNGWYPRVSAPLRPQRALRFETVELTGFAEPEGDRLAGIGAWRMAIAPNPIASEFATLRLSGPAAKRNGRVRIFDAVGRCVLVRPLVIGDWSLGIPLDLRRLSAGVYLVRLDADGTTATQKLVVQR